MKKTIVLSGLLIGLLIGSCKKSDNNTYTGQPMINYQMKATNTNYATARTTAGADIVWTSAIAYPDVIKFEAKQDNTEVEFKSKNNGPIDLMASVATTFGGFTIPPGTYDELSLKIDLDRMGDLPILTLSGKVTSGLVVLPVTIDITQSVELQTEQHDVTVFNDSVYTAVTTLDLSTLTAGITADMLLNAQLTSGTIMISANSNITLYHMIIDNLEHRHHHCDFERHHH